MAETGAVERSEYFILLREDIAHYAAEAGLTAEDHLLDALTAGVESGTIAKADEIQRFGRDIMSEESIVELRAARNRHLAAAKMFLALRGI